jgi:hypothetical protein
MQLPMFLETLKELNGQYATHDRTESVPAGCSDVCDQSGVKVRLDG